MMQHQAQFRTNPEAAADGFWRDGFHLEFGVRSDAECDRLIEAANSFTDLSGEDYRQYHQPHRRHAAFLDALRHSDIVTAAETLVGGEGAAIQSILLFGCPSTPGFPPHQDNIYVHADADKFLLTWSALADATPENGGLYLYPGSHKEPLLALPRVEQVTGPYFDPDIFTVEAPERYEAVDVTVPQGAVVFMHSHLIHGSHSNRTDGYRYAFFTSYIRRGEAFLPGNKAKRDEVPLH